MSAPRWTAALLRLLAKPEQRDEVLGDLEEAHRARTTRLGWFRANLLTGLEALDMAWVLLRERLRLPAVSWLDVKLGLRMVFKHPGLSVVSALGMTIAVGIGTSAFAAIHAITASPLPVDEGDRVVTIQNTQWGGLSQLRTTHLHDLPTWREASRSIGMFGAYRILSRNLVTEDGQVAPTRVVEMTASGFGIARVPPLLGRMLIEADEAIGGPAVVVIGYGVWQDRFGADPNAVGRTLQIGAVPHTIVGVMPQRFAFPINNKIWTPLRLNPVEYQRGEAPPIDVFGRLAPGFSLKDAQSEMELLGQRAAAAYSEESEGQSAMVFPYTQELFWGRLAWFLYLGQMLVSMLLVVIAINVAALVYARTATRSGEIVVRSALGASRARIATQLFVEAFVLSALAAAAGLVMASWGLEQIELFLDVEGGEQLPYWWDFSLTPATAFYGFGLAVLAAVIIGVVPALGMTGRRLRAGLQSVGSGASGPRLGSTWTTLIVAQVAVAVAVLPVGLNAMRWMLRSGSTTVETARDEFLTATLEFERDASVDDVARNGQPDEATVLQARRATIGALAQRLEAETEVSQVVLMEMSPWGDPDLPFELEGASAGGEATGLESAATGQLVGISRVGPDFFGAFRLSLVTGRLWDANDVAVGSNAIVVNQVFVDQVLAGGSPLGRRIRLGTRGDPAPGSEEAVWHTIVGVVQDYRRSGVAPPLHGSEGFARPEGKAFVPQSPGSVPRYLAVRTRTDAAQFTRRVAEIAAGVDARLQLLELSTMEEMARGGDRVIRLLAITLATLAGSVLLLSVAGLYALMSFTVVRRRREIGIRAALGARPHLVVRSVLARAMAQMTVGILIGLTLSSLLDRMVGGEMLSGRRGVLLPSVAALMLAVGVLAAWGPARRGLAIQPTEALKSE